MRVAWAAEVAKIAPKPRERPYRSVPTHTRHVAFGFGCGILGELTVVAGEAEATGDDSDEGGEAHAVCHRDRRHREKHRHGKRARASGTGRERGGPT